MSFKERAKEYLATNWGAPFVLAFIALLIASAAFLSLGMTNAANSIAVYAFYSLVIGVVLQIASYVKYGEGGEKKSSELSASLPKRRMNRKHIAAIVVVLIVLGAIAATLYYVPSTNPLTTHTTGGKFKVGLDFIQATPGPSGSEQVIFGINNTGGVQPYNFSAYWADGYNQTNNVGVFQRSFTYNQSVPSTVLVLVKSSDGEIANVTVSIPPVSRTTTSTATTTTSRSSTSSTTSSSTSLLYRIAFIESGLPAGQQWSVSFGPLSNSSASNAIEFKLPNGYYPYTISEPYARNYSWAAVATSASGTLIVNDSNVQVNITYTVVNVSTPQDRLFNLTGGPIVSTSNGVTVLNITYTNNFPVKLTGIILVSVNNSTTGQLVQLQSATISPGGSESENTQIYLSGLSPGNYSASIYVQDTSGASLSEVTQLHITVT
ncbi:MAG: hypothetical protein JRN20_19455 [Nitrososphaerota archaeon]|nr:hypothetical protein [Nitrososphaerota archaeon]